MGKKKPGQRPKKSKKHAELPDFIQSVEKHYKEEEEKNQKRLEMLNRFLQQQKKKILAYNIRVKYHKRNTYIQKLKETLRQRDALCQEQWKKQFFFRIGPFLDRYKDLKLSSSSSSEQEQQECLSQLNIAFLAQYRPHEAFPLAPQLKECPNPACNKNLLLLIQQEARLICAKCGHYSKQLVGTTNHSFGDENDTNSTHSAYERRKNFRAQLIPFGPDGKAIPDELLKDARFEFQHILNTSKKEIRSTCLRNWLKTSEKWKPFTDCSAKIVNILHGRPNPVLTAAEIEEYVDDFDQTQLPFLLSKDPDRQNYMSSNYAMNKFMGRRGKKHQQKGFPLLRHKKTLEKSDHVYAEMCQRLGWDFEPSV